MNFDPSVLNRPPSEWTDEELLALVNAEQQGGLFPGELSIEDAELRERVLDNPSVLATEVLDPEYYTKNFEAYHYELLDKVWAPYVRREPIVINGETHDPSWYRGIIILFPRGTLKSTLLRIFALWVCLYRKLRLGEDARIMLVHKVLAKSIEHGEVMKNLAKHHKLFRRLFPEFARQAGGQWDTQEKWRWPNFSQDAQTTEWSFTHYGETSSKTGGHYTDRMVDDWVNEDSVTTAEQLQKSEKAFHAMDQLRDRTRDWNPWILCGTHYHYQDTYKKLEIAGGWLVWRVPGHEGSSKEIFDLCEIPTNTADGRRRIELGLRKLEQERAGDLNFPKLLPWRELYATARATNRYEYGTQIQLNPMPEGDQRFDRERLLKLRVDKIPSPEESRVIIRCDPAISQKRDADECAIVVGLVKWDGSRTLIDGWVGKERRPSEIVRRMFKLAKKWRARGYIVSNIGVESVAYQEALAELCRGGVPAREPEFDGEAVPMMTAPCPVRSITRSPNVRKHERILEMDGPVTRGELTFWLDCPITDRAIDQLGNFPFDRDDILDALHDMWDGAVKPPRPITTKDTPVHRILQKHIAGLKKRGKVEMSNQVKLGSWGE